MGNKPIVHAPIATGSTEPRDIRDRFADFINLKDFGAVGDGATDDSTAWAAWGASLANGNGPCFIPKGNYALGDEILHVPNGNIYAKFTELSDPESTDINIGLFTHDVYVDGTNGSAANDGFTPSTAVNTISHALELIKGIPRINGAAVNICITAGTYVEDVNIFSADINFVLLGNVQITGTLTIDYNSRLTIPESEYTLTVLQTDTSTFDAALYILHNSIFDCYSDIVVTFGNTDTAGYTCVSVTRYSAAWFRKSITINATNISNYALLGRYHAFISVNNLTVNSSSASLPCSGFAVEWNSYGIAFGDYFNINNCYNTGIACRYVSTLDIQAKAISIKGSNTVNCEHSANLLIRSYDTLNLALNTNHANLAILYATRSSRINIVNGNDNCVTTCTLGNNARYLAYAEYQAAVHFSGTKVTWSGTVGYHALHSKYSSYIGILFTNVTNSVSGTKIGVNYNSVINFNGIAEAKVPGSGSIASSAVSNGSFKIA